MRFQGKVAIVTGSSRGIGKGTALALAREGVGRIDVLVNKAAVAFSPPVVETPPRHWDLVVKVNLRGPFLTSRAVLPTMMAQKSGSIVNISSTTADPQGPTYVG